MIIQNLYKQGLITPPKWLPDNIQCLAIMGSSAYGVANNDSDIDVYGWCIPPRHLIFPHINGEIPGFGTQTQRFEVWQQHHINFNTKEYDFAIYSIIKYFQLCMENNPNMIDSLFVPRRCIIHSTAISERVRENRKLFLHKGAWFKFKGYAYSQMHKIGNKTGAKNPKREAAIKEFGFDIKMAYHVVRLLNEVEMIMIDGDLDLERNNEQLKSIRRGEWSIEKLQNYFEEKEQFLEGLYIKSSLPHKPDEEKIKELLLECLEMAYGPLNGSMIVRDVSVDKILFDMQSVIDKHKTIDSAPTTSKKLWNYIRGYVTP